MIARDLYDDLKRERLESWKLMKQAQKSGALDEAAFYRDKYETATRILKEIAEV